MLSTHFHQTILVKCERGKARSRSGRRHPVAETKMTGETERKSLIKTTQWQRVGWVLPTRHV